MKKILFLLLVGVPYILMAQSSNTDTIYLKERKLLVKEYDGKVKVKLYKQNENGETFENKPIFEGIYEDGQSIEKRFSFTIPIIHNKNLKDFTPHYQGFYLGYSGFGTAEEPIAFVSSKSWEIGLNIFSTGFSLSRNNEWGLVSGIGWGYTSFRLEKGLYFTEKGGHTVVGDLGPNYSKGRLRYNYFRIPALLEWQSHSFNKRNPFVSAGLEAEIRYRIQSKCKGEHGYTHRIGSDMNVAPIGLNFMAQVGFHSISAYMRYSILNLFENGEGPDMHPLTLGLILNW